MKISFRHKKLRKRASEHTQLVKAYGSKCAKKITIRLGDMRAAKTLDDLREAPGRYHELAGDRKGQWSCDLVHPYRLIFEPHEQPIPINRQGQYLWMEITGVEVVEIIDYH